VATTDPEALRETVADAAEGILMDANVTFVALMRERGHANATTGAMILEEWIKALDDMAKTAGESLAQFRQTGVVASGDPLTAMIDDAVLGMIEERREQIRKIDEEADCPICKGPCQGH
jgi:hypothetical protein